MPSFKCHGNITIERTNSKKHNIMHLFPAFFSLKKACFAKSFYQTIGCNAQ